jgi:adenylate cyclase
MLRQWLSYELADCASSIFLAVVPVLVSINVPILPSYLGEHVEAECNAYEVPPMEKDFYVITIWSEHKWLAITITCKEFS